MSNSFTKYAFSAIAILLLVTALAGCTSSNMFNANQQKSKYFKPAGHLNYEYDPGVILPLRNGKILALGGIQHIKKNQPEKFFQAEDGKMYGYGSGMTELFDPDTGQTKVLTKMPFKFYVLGAPNRRQMKAIELEDGRIFIVGKFEDNRDVPPDEAKRRYEKWFGKDCRHKLPVFSKNRAGVQLHSIAPCTEPHLFGLIYDWRNHTFEIVNTPDEIPPRYMVTLNLLPDGRVLIIGGSIADGGEMGYSGNYPETRVLIFDPKTKKISVVGNLLHTRYGHETIPLSDTKFMLFGGWGVSDTEAKETFCALSNPDGTCNWTRHHERTREVEVYDLKTGLSRIVGHTLGGRYDFSAIRFPNETVFINGGAVSSLRGYPASELYDLKTGTSTYIGESRMPEKLKHATPEDLIPYHLFGEGIWYRAIGDGEIVLIVGINQAFVYDWHDFTNESALKKHHFPDKLLSLRDDHHLVKTPDGRVFVIGGLAYSDMTGSAVQGKRAANLIEEFVYPTKESAKGE